MRCWMNGVYMEASELRISPFDHGFLYGLGFFETFRTYEGKVLFFNAHMERLHAALKQYRIHMPYTPEEILEVVQHLNEQAGHTDGYFRVNVSAGEHGIGLQPNEYTTPNVIVFRKELLVAPIGQEKTAQWLKTLRNSPEHGVRVKSHHYGNNVLGRFELPSLATQEGIFLTEEGHIGEGVTSNIFWVKNDILFTPSLETGILPGITREWVIQKARQLGIRVEVGLYTQKDIEWASECFVTNSVQGIVPIVQLEDKEFLGNEGPLYDRLIKAYIEESKER